MLLMWPHSLPDTKLVKMDKLKVQRWATEKSIIEVTKDAALAQGKCAFVSTRDSTLRLLQSIANSRERNRQSIYKYYGVQDVWNV